MSEPDQKTVIVPMEKPEDKAARLEKELEDVRREAAERMAADAEDKKDQDVLDELARKGIEQKSSTPELLMAAANAMAQHQMQAQNRRSALATANATLLAERKGGHAARRQEIRDSIRRISKEMMDHERAANEIEPEVKRLQKLARDEAEAKKKAALPEVPAAAEDNGEPDTVDAEPVAASQK